MINWMQKHRKALIPTIWISTIAFVGAYAVGWGAYDMNSSRAKSVAKVGSENITIQEFQNKYRNLYGYFQTVSDGKFTQEDAEKMNLEEVALNELIRESLYINFAKDLGLDATDDDFVKYLISSPEFQTNGVFDKEKYTLILKQNGIKAQDFEASLKKQIIIDKLNHALNLEVSDNDIDALATAYFIQDKISMQIVEKSGDINASDAEIKEFWEAHKNNYLTERSYDLDTYFVEIKPAADVNESELEKFYDDHKSSYRDGEDKVLEFAAARDAVLQDYSAEDTRKIALKTYLALKDGELTETNKMLVAQNDENFPVEELADKKVGEFNKPFEFKNGFLITKLNAVVEPQPMEFDAAKELVSADFMSEKTAQTLENDAKAALADFNGTDVGFVTRDTAKLGDLSEDETRTFLDGVFTKANLEGYVILPERAVVYKVSDQKIDNSAKIDEYKEILAQNSFNLKNGVFKNNLLEALQKRYEIKKYFKGSEN